jgi:hypothetical protein
MLIPNPSLNTTTDPVGPPHKFITHIHKTHLNIILRHFSGSPVIFFQEVSVPNFFTSSIAQLIEVTYMLLTVADVCKWRSSSLRDVLNCSVSPSVSKYVHEYFIFNFKLTLFPRNEIPCLFTKLFNWISSFESRSLRRWHGKNFWSLN